MRLKRSLITVAAVGLGVLAGVVLAVVPRGYRQDGPLQASSATEVAFPLAPDKSATWGMALPNPTVAEIEILSIDAVAVEGLSVLGIMVSRTGVNSAGSIVNAPGWPPAGITTQAPAGSVIPAVGSSTAGLQVLVGIKHLQGAATGTIGGLHLRYRAGRDVFEVVFPWSLRITPGT